MFFAIQFSQSYHFYIIIALQTYPQGNDGAPARFPATSKMNHYD